MGSNGKSKPADNKLNVAAKEVIALLKKEDGHDLAVEKIIGFQGQKPATRFELIRALVSTGQAYKNSDLTQCALDAFDKLKAKAPNDPALYYDIATGYQELYDFRHRDDKMGIFDCEEIIKRGLKYADKTLPTDARAGTNQGNFYDAIGRPVEAIDCYERVIKQHKDFGMAIGNKAIALEILAPITRYSTTYKVYAHQLYQEAFANKQSIIDAGNTGSLEVFQQRDKDIVRRFTDAGQATMLDKDLTHEHYDGSGMSDFVKFYTDFCIRNDLYLNLHIVDKNADASIGDAIIPKLITHSTDDDEQKYVDDIIFRLNEIIETYMTARMSLVQSQYTNNDFSVVSQQTTLINLLDYSVSNIYVGYLKSAYKEAFSALDKIAVLVNHYLDLDLDEERCYYRNVWYAHDEKGEILEPKVFADKVKGQGYRLFGLYLLCDELCGSKYSHLRNAMTHRYVRTYRAISGPKGTYTFEELAEVTVAAFHKIKCAIMYATLFIESRERAKHKGGFIPQMPLNTDQNLDIW